MKLKLIDILNDIMKMDRIEMDKVMEAVRNRRDQLHFSSARTFRVGDRVKFKGRGGLVVTGSISKVKIKKCSVEADNGQRWNVPAGMLVAMEDKVVA